MRLLNMAKEQIAIITDRRGAVDQQPKIRTFEKRATLMYIVDCNAFYLFKLSEHDLRHCGSPTEDKHV